MPKLLNLNSENCVMCINAVFDLLNEAIALNEIIFDVNENPVDINFTEVNNAFKKIFKLPDDCDLKNILPELTLYYKDIKWNDILEVIINGTPIRFEYPELISGKYYQVNIIKIAEKRIASIFMDITLEKKTVEIKQKHQILFENAQDIILYVRMDGTIADANKCAIEKYGYYKEEIITKKIQDIRHPSTMEVFEKQMLQADQGGVLFECVHRKKGG